MRDHTLYPESAPHGTLLSDEENNRLWDRIYTEYKWSDSNSAAGITPPFPFDIYDASGIWTSEENIEKINILANEAVISCIGESEQIYALDRQHSGILFDPRNPDTMRNFTMNENTSEWYNVYFPEYIPNGDTYIFIPKDFRFGWFADFGRQQICVWGEGLRLRTAGFAAEVGLLRLVV